MGVLELTSVGLGFYAQYFFPFSGILASAVM